MIVLNLAQAISQGATMRDVLQVWEEGQSALFFISAPWPATGRHFVRNADPSALEVQADDGTVLVTLLLQAEAWSVIDHGRAHWLESDGQRLTVQVVIHLARVPA